MLEAAANAAIIAIAVELIGFFIMGLIGIFIAWRIYQLIGFLRVKAEEFSVLGRALMESAQQSAQTAGQAVASVNEAATTVKGSTEFVSDTLVSPVVQVVSAAAGARSFVAALFRLSDYPRHGGRT